MKKRKIYCLLILVFIFTISIICYINNNSEKSFYISFQKSQVNNYLKKYLKNKSYTVAITNYSENIIQGEIYDTGSNGNLFLTTGLFLYDIEKNKYDFFEYTEKNRILKYYISDEKIYASIICTVMGKPRRWNECLILNLRKTALLSPRKRLHTTRPSSPT